MRTTCDVCGAQSNSAPGLPCDWRADGLPDDDEVAVSGGQAPRCAGTYRAETASAQVVQAMGAFHMRSKHLAK